MKIEELYPAADCKTDGKRFFIKEFTYKVVSGIELGLRIYFPSAIAENSKRKVIMFFFGGGWVEGTIEQFKPQCEHFVSKGLVCITPDYRVYSRHGTNPLESIKDAKDALNWVVENSHRLWIDKNGIVVSGGSAGGHLALCTGMIKDPEYDPYGVHKVPKAFILFNPVTDTTETGYGSEKLGASSTEVSPFHLIEPGLPPAVLFHGTKDEVVPYNNAIDFYRKMKLNSNVCKLYSYEGRYHGFFNPDRDHLCYQHVLKNTECFLREYGFIE